MSTDQTITPEERMRLEETIQERIGENGDIWHKVYFGGGFHMRNWLEQVEEVYGKENVEIEETDSTGFQCFEESGEKMYRIWARHKK